MHTVLVFALGWVWITEYGDAPGYQTGWFHCL